MSQCFVCGQGVIEDSMVALPDGKVMHWECFFQLALSLEKEEQKEKENGSSSN